MQEYSYMTGESSNDDSTACKIKFSAPCSNSHLCVDEHFTTSWLREFINTPPRDTFTYSTVHEPATWTGSEAWRSDTSTRPGIKLSRKARRSMYWAFTATGEWVQDLRGCAVDGQTLAPAADFVKCKWRSTRIWAFTVTRVGVELTWWKADELIATRLAPAL